MRTQKDWTDLEDAMTKMEPDLLRELIIKLRAYHQEANVTIAEQELKIEGLKTLRRDALRESDLAQMELANRQSSKP